MGLATSRQKVEGVTGNQLRHIEKSRACKLLLAHVGALMNKVDSPHMLKLHREIPAMSQTISKQTPGFPVILGDGSSVHLPNSILGHSPLLRCMAEEAAQEGSDDITEEPLQLPISAGITRRGVCLLAQYFEDCASRDVLSKITWPSLDAVEFTRAGSFLDVHVAVKSAVSRFAARLASCESACQVEEIFASGCKNVQEGAHEELEPWMLLAPLLGQRADCFIRVATNPSSILHRLSPDILQAILRDADELVRQDTAVSTLLSGTGNLEDALIKISCERYRGSSLLSGIVNQFSSPKKRVRRASLQAVTYVADMKCCRCKVRRPHSTFDCNKICVTSAVASQLSDCSKHVREEAVKVLDMFSPAICAYDATSLILKHRRTCCRAAAASAFPAVISDSNVDGLLNLVPMLEDGDSETRQAASESLGKLVDRFGDEADLSQTSVAVARLLQHRNPCVRAAAMAPMAQMAHRHNRSDTVKTLLGFIRDKSATVRCACAKSLACVASCYDMEVGLALVGCLADHDRDVQEESVKALRSLTNAGMDGSSVMTAISELLRHKHSQAAVQAMSAMMELAPFCTLREVRQVTARLSDVDGFVRLQAGRALRQIASKGEPEVVAALLEAAHDDDEEVRAEAIRTLGCVAHAGDVEALRGAIAACSDASSTVQSAASRSLIKLAAGGQGGLVATETLCCSLQKPNARQQLRILDVLSDIVGRDLDSCTFAARALQKLLLDPHGPSEKVLVASLESLADIAMQGGDDCRRCAKRTVEAFVQDENWIIREAAENAMSALDAASEKGPHPIGSRSDGAEHVKLH